MLRKSKKKRVIFVIFNVFVAILAVFFIISNFRSEIVFFYSPSELLEKEISSREIVRIGGLVKKGSVKRIDALQVEFVVEDGVGEVLVRHKGLTPDLFREGQGVVAKGIFDGSKKLFLSQELLVKHDEKYMPPEVAKKVKR